MSRSIRRTSRALTAGVEAAEARCLLSGLAAPSAIALDQLTSPAPPVVPPGVFTPTTGTPGAPTESNGGGGGGMRPAANPLAAILRQTPFTHVVRPNTPVAPFGSDPTTASFIDPSVRVTNGNHIVIGIKSLVGPYATLDARSGFLKIGSVSAVLDNATIQTSPPRTIPPSSVLIGDSALVSFGATVIGPSTIGGFGVGTLPTLIGPNALVEGANVEPGSIVGALARVGPGVTVPAGTYVQPGANITTQAEASNPALGMVRPVTAAELKAVSDELAHTALLANGYTTLYEGSSSTGANPGVPASVTGVNNGNLAAVEGTSQEPGPTPVTFEPKKVGPTFPTPRMGNAQGLISTFRGRIIGQAVFHQRAALVAHHLGRSNAFRADDGQPITIGSIAATGTAVTINAPSGATSSGADIAKKLGQVVIGQDFRADDHAVLLGGPTAVTKLGDNVTLGAGSVVDESTIGSGATIGARVYVLDSTVPAGATVPPGTILIKNKVTGSVTW